MRKKVAFHAMLVAVYVVLSLLVIPIGGIKITFEHFPVILCAVLYGPVDAMVVGGLGELLNQMTSYGITPTTGLWILPIIFRGFSMGLCAKVFPGKMGAGAIRSKKFPILFSIATVVTGICSSILNTVALYLDSKMFGYYNYAMVFGALILRILLGVLTSVVIAACIKSVLHALKKVNME